MAKKIDLMYEIFGKIENGSCIACNHMLCVYGRSRKYYKCKAYGVTSSESSDWSHRHVACGLFPDKPLPAVPVIQLARKRKLQEKIPGQINIFGEVEE